MHAPHEPKPAIGGNPPILSDVVGDVMRSFAAWLRDVGNWWWAAVVGLMLGGVALVQTIQQLHRYLPWVLVAALGVALVGSFPCVQP